MSSLDRPVGNSAWALQRAGEEARKIPAFFRRDLMVMWSYRLAFFFGWGTLLAQVLMFSFVGQMVDPDALPSFGDGPTAYIDFVAIGMAVSSFSAISVNRVASALRNEQLMGTLESVLMTPTSALTVQLGSVVYDLAFVPLQTGLFLALAAAVVGISFAPSGILPATAVLLAFVPFMWGMGMVGAAGVLVFRKGASAINVGSALLFISSGTFFPVELFPSWLAELSLNFNPITVSLYAMREALLGGAGWAGVSSALLFLLPAAALSIATGVAVFRWALQHQRRKGTLGLY